MTKWRKINEERNFPPTVDWDKTSEITGVIVRFKETEIEGDKRRCAIIKTENGEVTVWHSARLEPLFNLPEGQYVRIVFNGWEKLKAGKRLRSFDVFVPEPDYEKLFPEPF